MKIDLDSLNSAMEEINTGIEHFRAIAEVVDLRAVLRLNDDFVITVTVEDSGNPDIEINAEETA